MKVYKCDRCGNIYDAWRVKATQVYDAYLKGEQLNLCLDCSTELEKFMEGKNAKNNKKSDKA